MSANAIAQKLDSIQTKGAMRAVDIANLLDARPETVSRWNKGKAFPREQALNILLELEYLVDQLADFYEPNEVRLWMFSRQRLLDGEKPAELVKQGKIDKVMQLVNQLRDGVYI